MSKRIGYNIIGDAPNVDLERAYQHVAKAKPAWVIVINRLDLAKRIADNVPETNVIVRWVTADNDPIKAYGSPENFIAFVRREFNGAGLYANISNESGFSDEQLTFTCDVIDKGPELRFAVFGGSIGTPEPADWKRPKAVELLKRLAAQHQRLVLNLHDGYFPAVPHAGMEGQAYTNPHAMPPDIRDIKCWLVGRYQFLVKACQDLELPIPRIVVGECGADRIDQFKAWLGTLQQTPPYVEIRGWKTLKAQWQTWYGKDPERVLYDMLTYLDKVVYYIPQAEGMCLFAWCSPQSEWEQFDVSQALTFQKLVEEGANVPDTVIIPAAGRYIYKGNARTIRAIADTSGTKRGVLNNGDSVVILPSGSKPADGYTWMECLVRDTIQGWIAYVKSEMEFTPQTQPEPEPEPDVEYLFTEIKTLVSQQRVSALAAVNAQFDALEAGIIKLESKYLADSEERVA